MLRNWARTVTDDGVCCYKSVFADERTIFEYLFFPGRQCHTEVSLSGNVRMSEHLEKRMGNQVREEIRFRIENGLLPIGKDAAFAESAVLKVHEIEAQRWFFRRANMDAEDCLTRFRYVAANVEFDVIMRARIEDETTGEVFLRKYIVNGACGLADREEYYGWGLIAPYTPCMRVNEDMDDYMVPFLSAKQRENALHTFFDKYFLDDGNLQHRAVLPSELAARMKMRVIERRLTHDNSILGRIVYDKGPVEIYDEKNSFYSYECMPSKTILIDPTAIQSRPGAHVEDVIAHECIHYEKDRMYYMLQKRYKRERNLLACPAMLQGDPASPLYRLEKQTRQMSFLLRMPDKITDETIKGLLEKHSDCAKRGRVDTQYERTVQELALRFNVSKQAAKYRMIELGYPLARGVFNYVNGRYAPSYTLNPAKSTWNQTYTLSREEASRLYLNSSEFRKTLSTGKYVYVDGHFCLNVPKYVYASRSGRRSLTTYGRTHLDECCLSFSERWLDDRTLSPNGLHSRKRNPEKSIELNKEQKNRLEGYIAGFESFKNQEEERQALPRNFPDLLVHLMDMQNYKIPDLAERSKVSMRTISRLRGEGKPNSLQTAMGLCIGLNLDADVGMYFIMRSGFQLLEDDPEQSLYRFMIESMPGESIDVCNKLIEHYHFQPIGAKGENLN